MSKKITVLAVDDEIDILFTLEAIGKLMGWKVYGENDGGRALLRAQHLKPDIILLDYHMPRHDGLTTLKALRQWNKDLPIIILTVDERQDVANRFLDAGASDFANKPVKVADLAARINVHLQLRSHQKALLGHAFTEKGINSTTLEMVRSFCQTMSRPFLIEEVADGVGLAYQTVVRYLHYLEAQQELASESGYGKIGRPRKKYQYIKK